MRKNNRKDPNRKRPLARLLADSESDAVLKSITGGCTSTNTCATSGPDEDERPIDFFTT